GGSLGGYPGDGGRPYRRHRFRPAAGHEPDHAGTGAGLAHQGRQEAFAGGALLRPFHLAPHQPALRSAGPARPALDPARGDRGGAGAHHDHVGGGQAGPPADRGGGGGQDRAVGRDRDRFCLSGAGPGNPDHDQRGAIGRGAGRFGGAAGSDDRRNTAARERRRRGGGQPDPDRRLDAGAGGVAPARGAVSGGGGGAHRRAGQRGPGPGAGGEKGFRAGTLGRFIPVRIRLPRKRPGASRWSPAIRRNGTGGWRMSKKNLSIYPPVTLVGYVYGMVDKLG